ncbi:MAG: hypothetical protein L0Y71_23510 [Gemmataceae bacterium]|nr:hypothetical protein [Gemmataceae bacterium]
MTSWWILLLVILAAIVMFAAWEIHRRHLTRWLIPYVRERRRRRLPGPDEEIHVLLCIADHFEPKGDGADAARGAARVRHWRREYPRRLGSFRDSDGRPPRYTFFFPVEEYESEYLEQLGELCRDGFAEVEIHLHHQHDTAEGLRRKLETFRDLLVERHGLLSRHRATGAAAYAFVHGNWALCNSRPDGSWCGVNNELAILHETGCYADMTYPSAPDPTQPPVINRIYHARDIPGRPRSHEVGCFPGNGPPPEDAVMMIQGPLVLDWGRRKWGVLPRLENGCLQASQPPAIERLDAWLRARVQMPGRPDWFFVKLHAHGASEEFHECLLGEPMVRFHQELARRAREDRRFHYHYVTAREMYNLARAAEAGYRGPVADALDFELVSNIADPAGGTGDRHVVRAQTA